MKVTECFIHGSFARAVLAAGIVNMAGLAAVAQQNTEQSAAQLMAVTTAGQTLVGHLVDVTADGSFVFDRAGRQHRVARRQLVAWGRYADRDRGTQLVLTDGGTLVADVYSMDTETVVITGRLWKETHLPRSCVRAIVFRPPLDPLARDRLMARIAAGQRREDRLLLENGDELVGRLASTVRPDPGAFKPTVLPWRASGRGESTPVPIDGVIALLMSSPIAASSSTRSAMIAGFRDGSQLYVSRLMRGQQGLVARLSCGFELATEPVPTTNVNPWRSVVSLQPLDAEVTYLSDLEPVGYKHIPYLEREWTWRRDRSVAGGRLRHAGHVFTKGLGMHSSSRLAYDTGGRYRWLQAELAIDEVAGRQGSVIFRVYVQQAGGAWTRAFESPVVRGGAPLVPMRINIAKAARVALIVDFADRADQWDHADWINARFVPGP